VLQGSVVISQPAILLTVERIVFLRHWL
jgi:hypothetical protein